MKSNYLYSVTDKALYDGLNQHKITSNHIVDMFLKRGVLVSKQTLKKSLAQSFCRYHHDYYDHQLIAEVLGMTPRKEKITSSFIKTECKADDFWSAAEDLKKKIINNNDQCNIYSESGSIIIDITYSSLHYEKSEFNQIVKKNAKIEIIKKDDKYIIRRPDNEKMDDYVDDILNTLSETENEVEKKDINLFSVTDPKLRSKFFNIFVEGIPKYKLKNVSDVFVFNPDCKYNSEDMASLEDGDLPEIKKVSLKGVSVLDSPELSDLFKRGFYIWKIRWAIEENLADPDIFEFEAQFNNMEDFTGFSYISKGYWKYKGNGEYNKNKSQLEPGQNSRFITLLEKCALETMELIQAEYQGVTIDEHTEKQMA
ncbi:hypothetical protein ACQKC1_02645 [Shewanella baltica]|uniref:hypothetical protein n=1 Tax=Shewanella baltica TaxID=62322 RepID=UPI003D05B3F0